MYCTCGQEIKAQWAYCPYCGKKAQEQINIITTKDMPRKIVQPPKDYHERIREIKKGSPKAYEPWTLDEEQKLIALYKNGAKIKEISEQLQRQTGAIRARLKKIEER